MLVRCENGDYAADIDAARGIPRPPEFPAQLDAPEEVETPERDDDRRRWPPSSSIDPAATSKAMPVIVGGDRVMLALVRGDDRLSEEKLTTMLGEAFRPLTDDEIRETFGAGGGSLGPVGVKIEVVADKTLREGQFVAGANRDGWHLRGVEAGRDYEAEFADIRRDERGRQLSAMRRQADWTSPRSSSGTSSSSARSIRCGLARRTWTRTGRRSRS